MINVIVSYQIKPEFLSKNRANIDAFLKDFESLDTSKFSYTVLVNNEELVFTHLSTYTDEQVQQQVLQMPSFLEFQRQRDESGLNDSHKVQVVEYLGSVGGLSN